MTKEEFISRRTAAELKIKLKPRPLIPWGFFFAIGFAMFIAIPSLTVLLCLVLLFKYPAAPPMTILWEIGFCLLLTGILKYQIWSERQRWLAIAKDVGLECPSCHKSIYYKNKIVLETGRCWNCGAQVFDQ